MGKPRHKSPDILSDLIELLAGVQPADRTAKPASDESRTVPFDNPSRNLKPQEERYPLKLTQSQRNALVDHTDLDRSMKDRIHEMSPGTKPLMVTEQELEAIGDAADDQLGLSSGTLARSLAAIVDKVDELLIEIDIKALKAKRCNLPRTTKVYQFKVTIKGSHPPIWREFQTQDCTLGELHELLQDVMGWTDSHLHQFVVKRQIYGNPAQLDTGFGMGYGDEIHDEDATLICQRPIFRGKLKFLYEYDFGDGWEHEVVLEKELTPEKEVNYPRCLSGARACPPEDCGGLWGNAEFLDAMSDPTSGENLAPMEWYPDGFDADEFSVDEINYHLRRN